MFQRHVVRANSGLARVRCVLRASAIFRTQAEAFLPSMNRTLAEPPSPSMPTLQDLFGSKDKRHVVVPSIDTIGAEERLHQHGSLGVLPALV